MLEVCTIMCFGIYRHLVSGHEICRLQHCPSCIMLVTLAYRKSLDRSPQLLSVETSGYATWFTAGGAIRIAHYDVIDDVGLVN